MTDYDWKNDRRIVEILAREPPIHFPARDLEPYPQPVSADQLRDGSLYYCLNYVDHEMLIPVMDSIVFIGRNLKPGDAGLCYFQQICWYDEGKTFDSEAECDDAIFYARAENKLSDIFEYELALEELMRCSLRRKGALGEE